MNSGDGDGQLQNGRFTLMEILLLLPFFLIRFGLLSLLNKEAVGRAAYFAPLQGNEKTACIFYQISNIAIFVYILFLKVSCTPAWLFFTGLAIYIAGVILLLISVVNFASPSENGINKKRALPRVAQSHVCGLFCLFHGICADDTVLDIIGSGNHFPDIGPLDYSF